MIYDQPSNTSVSKNIESVQYNAALAITGAIKGSSCEKIVLGVRTGIPLWNKTGEKIVFTLYKVFSIGQPYYIYDLLPSIISSHGHANLNISRTFLFLMSLMNGINWILTFAVPLQIPYIVTYYSRLLGLFKERSSILMIQQEKSYY